MEVSYQREMKHNYMILEPDEVQPEGFEIRMMASNSIEGLLRFRWKQTDQGQLFYYEITSKQPLSRLLEVCAISAEEIRRLIFGIAQTLNRMESYLLREDQILLEPDFIYIEPHAYSVYLCLVPGRKEDFPQAFSRLLQYILSKVNHQDRECVVLAYGLYQESLKENYGIRDLLYLLKTERADDAETDESAGPFVYTPGILSESREQVKVPIMNFEISEMTVEDRESTHHKVSSKAGIVGKEKKGRRLRKKLLTSFLVMAGIPVIIWLRLGNAGLYRYGKIVALCDAVVLVSLLLSEILDKSRNEKSGPLRAQRLEADIRPTKDNADESGNWRKALENDSPEPGEYGNGKGLDARGSVRPKKPDGGFAAPRDRAEAGASVGDSGKLRDMEPMSGSEAGETVLLMETDARPSLHRLNSLDKGVEDISIPYYPFVIGKQESLVDYTIRRDTVSRIHLRLDQVGEDCYVTDLNSTNGTSVRGVPLNNNETVQIQPGDEISIAGIDFIFL